MLLLSTNAYSLDVEDIVSLSKANVGDDIILSVIAVSDEQINLSTQDIILLKKEGVSDKIIKTLIRKSKTAKKAKKFKKIVAPKNKVLDAKKEEIVASPEEKESKELKPFDQFFLSTYYSHQYGNAKKDYKSTSDLLGQGLYYNGGYKKYPNARRVRVRGNSYSYDRFGSHYSPYSIIVPKHSYNRRYSNRYNRHYRSRHFGSHYQRSYRRCR